MQRKMVKINKLLSYEHDESIVEGRMGERQIQIGVWV